MGVRNSREEWKIYGNVFDQFTNRTLHALAHKGYFEELVHALQVGKEANIFLGRKDDGFVVVKIYRLENSNFKKMMQYMRSDPRFPNLRPNKRDIIFAWVNREYRNIMLARNAGCRVPMPIIQKNHILIEEFIGDGKDGAPQLKNMSFTKEEAQECYDDVVQQMKLLKKKAKIVHADLSDFNILYHEGKPVLIDFSQATSTDDYHAEEYLQRDVKNITHFFKRYKLDISEEELLKKLK